MKLKSLLFVGSWVIASSLFAANIHTHSKTNQIQSPSAKNAVKTPGPCEIEIINESYNDAQVHGIFDDGDTVDFPIFTHDMPQYIKLDYYGFCHPDMFIEIYSSGYKIYSDYTQVGTTIHIVPYLTKQPKVQVIKK